MALTAIVGVVIAGSYASVAVAAHMHRLAGTVSGFAVDGQRWAIWQVRPRGPIEVLDSSDGDLRTVASGGCTLPPLDEELPQLAYSDGAFLLECGSNTFAALHARTGETQPLPTGYDWRRVGSLYAEQGDEGCESPLCTTAILDLATGALSVRAGPRLYDLDRPVAPALPICARLRRRVRRVLEATEEVGVFQPGMFAREAAPEGRTIVIERCGGVQAKLRPPREPRDLQLGDGLLSWDTGLAPREERSEANALLTGYSLRSGSQRSWTLPRVPARETAEAPAQRDIWGYSAHAGDTVFWEAVTAGHYTLKFWVPSRFALYTARW